MKYILNRAFLVLILSNFAAVPLAHGQSSGRVAVSGDGYRVELAFSGRDEELIRKYYTAGHASRLPPGLAKKGALPPGLRKQLREKGSLPPGLRGRYLPGELERALSPLPRGYIRLRIGPDFVLLNSETRAILDLYSPFE